MKRPSQAASVDVAGLEHAYGAQPVIRGLAFSLAYPVALIVTRLPVGLLYVRDLAALRASQREG